MMTVNIWTGSLPGWTTTAIVEHSTVSDGRFDKDDVTMDCGIATVSPCSSNWQVIKSTVHPTKRVCINNVKADERFSHYKDKNNVYHIPKLGPEYAAF